MYEEIKRASAEAMTELLNVSKLREGSLVVVGCSSSEILGQRIGKGSSPEAAQAVVDAILPGGGNAGTVRGFNRFQQLCSEFSLSFSEGDRCFTLSSACFQRWLRMV